MRTCLHLYSIYTVDLYSLSGFPSITGIVGRVRLRAPVALQEVCATHLSVYRCAERDAVKTCQSPALKAAVKAAGDGDPTAIQKWLLQLETDAPLSAGKVGSQTMSLYHIEGSLH